MPRFYLETTVTVTPQAPQIVLVNPAASGVDVVLRSVTMFGASLTAMNVERYDVEVALSALGPTPPVPQSLDVPGALSRLTVATVDSHTITDPDPAHLTM